MSNLNTPKTQSVESISIIQFLLCFAIVASTADMLEDNEMSGGNEAVELTDMDISNDHLISQKKNVSLNELPDDILTKIVGMLDLKTAVTTSALSKRWKYICYKWIGTLISLTFESLNISNLELANFIKRCPLLEHLTLRTCCQLTKLITCDSFNTGLKILSLHRCRNLRDINLGANNLHTLEYTSMPSLHSFKINAPTLVNVFAAESRNFRYPIGRLCYDIPMLENLILSPAISCRFFKYNHPGPAFSNLRRLVLSVSPFSNDDKLVWVSYILKAFPLLQTLELNMCSSVWQPTEIGKGVLDKFPNRSITKLELNGFVGRHNEVYLFRYLLENLAGLRFLAIGPSEKVYTSFNCCVRREASIMGKEWFENHSRWVRAVVSRAIHLEFLEC